VRVPILGISRILGLSTWEFWGKWHLGATPMASHKEYYKRKGGVFSPNPSHDQSCEFVYAHGLFVHQKCSNYALTDLLFGLCRSIWIIDPLIIHPSPHPKAPTHPSYPQSATNKKTYPTCSSFVISTFKLTFESFKEFRGVSQMLKNITLFI
jgi:hypothetical protein